MNYTYDNLNKKAKIIQIELEKKMLGRYFPISLGICADAATVTRQICNEIKAQKLILDTNTKLDNTIAKRNRNASILDKVATMKGSFNRIFIEVDYTFTQKVIEHSLMKESAAMICSGADQIFNSDEFTINWSLVLNDMPFP